MHPISVPHFFSFLSREHPTPSHPQISFSASPTQLTSSNSLPACAFQKRTLIFFGIVIFTYNKSAEFFFFVVFTVVLFCNFPLPLKNPEENPASGSPRKDPARVQSASSFVSRSRHAFQLSPLHPQFPTHQYRLPSIYFRFRVFALLLRFRLSPRCPSSSLFRCTLPICLVNFETRPQLRYKSP